MLFVLNSMFLGVGLAMDAFSVSLANGLNEPMMSRKRSCAVAGVFALFQWLMPMIGWILVHSIEQAFHVFEKWIPWIALFLLSFIGIKMIVEGIRHKGEDDREIIAGPATLFTQGVATSIDALSVGFAIAGYEALMALGASLIIGGVTFILCFLGLQIGKKFGTKLTGISSILGGIILIAIGLEIFFV